MTTPMPLRLAQAEEVVVRMLAQDFSEPEIARLIDRSRHTVNQAVRRAMQRNGLKTRVALVRAYEERGFEVLTPQELRG